MHVSTRALQTWEAGEQNPRLDTFLVIADVMHVSLDFLAGRDAFVTLPRGEVQIMC